MPVKLCRFELKSAPGQARSGMVYSGKIYETDGANPVAVHEAEDVRPLAPIPLPPSLRIFRSDCQADPLEGTEEDPRFFYGNPASVVGSGLVIPFPEFAVEVGVVPCIAAILLADGFRVDLAEADDLILGYTLVNFVVAKEVERAERRSGSGFGRSHDIAAAIGPVITTPEELEDELNLQGKGRHYQLTSILRVNGVEVGRGTTDDLPFTFAQAIQSASQSCPLRAGDVIALGPIAELESGEITIGPEDQVQLAVEKLGTLSLLLSPRSELAYE